MRRKAEPKRTARAERTAIGRGIELAIRNIRTDGNPVLREICKEVKKVTDGTRRILDDMTETMFASDGVGLAAPQIGIPKRMVVIDDREGHSFKLVNPEIVSREGEQISSEGCLSIPGYQGKCKRPLKVTVKALNEYGEPVEFTAEGQLAVICCHEFDHLDGILYKDKAIEFMKKDEE